MVITACNTIKSILNSGMKFEESVLCHVKITTLECFKILTNNCKTSLPKVFKLEIA